MKNMIRMIVMGFSLYMSCTTAMAVCTESVTIEKLWPSAGGGVHIQIKDMADSDLMNCGRHSIDALILNYNDSSGTLEGKKMLYTALLTSLVAGLKVKLCSSKCDSQHPDYSTLINIYEMEQ